MIKKTHQNSNIAFIAMVSGIFAFSSISNNAVAEDATANNLAIDEIIVTARKKDESIQIPDSINYESFSGLSKEIKSKLNQIIPKTLGQALRIDGVTPAAAILLLGYIKKSRYKASA